MSKGYIGENDSYSVVQSISQRPLEEHLVERVFSGVPLFHVFFNSFGYSILDFSSLVSVPQWCILPVMQGYTRSFWNCRKRDWKHLFRCRGPRHQIECCQVLKKRLQKIAILLYAPFLWWHERKGLQSLDSFFMGKCSKHLIADWYTTVSQGSLVVHHW